MKVIIPVAGVGNRLKPHTLTQPKPLLEVAGRAILASILAPIMKLDPDEFIFVIGFKGEEIRRYINDNYDFKATFIEQDKLLGLGYAVNLALQDVGDEPILIVLGDCIVQCDLGKFVKAGSHVLGLRQVNDPHRFGIAETDNGRIIRLEEKPDNPKTNLAVIGLYYIEKSSTLRNYLQKNVDSDSRTSGEIQLTDALQAMIAEGIPFVPFEVQEWFDCGKKETVLATNRQLLKETPTPAAIDGVTFNPPVYLGPGAQISKSTIGPNVSISENAQVSGCTITNSIVGAKAIVEDCTLSDSYLGPNTVARGVKGTLNLGDSSEVNC